METIAKSKREEERRLEEHRKEILRLEQQMKELWGPRYAPPVSLFIFSLNHKNISFLYDFDIILTCMVQIIAINNFYITFFFRILVGRK